MVFPQPLDRNEISYCRIQLVEAIRKELRSRDGEAWRAICQHCLSRNEDLAGEALALKRIVAGEHESGNYRTNHTTPIPLTMDYNTTAALNRPSTKRFQPTLVRSNCLRRTVSVPVPEALDTEVGSTDQVATSIPGTTSERNPSANVSDDAQVSDRGRQRHEVLSHSYPPSTRVQSYNTLQIRGSTGLI